uniref:Protein Zds1 C-terminal domain-containing protein n=1 Tax=Melanopsichium pennsylvanicum 4 TaxID=1398559 RepID=A0A077R406_9BASI|nr:conserved hypothetical protein [Melanopsichium pennsylvanicum 4]
MSGGPMRITDDELAREVEALKSHRRISVNRPVLDPDLPDLAAAYGGGQELLSIPSPERERRGYSLVDDGAVPIRSPSSSSNNSLSPVQSYANERARFTARRRGPGSEHSPASEHITSSPTRLSPVSASPTSDGFDSRGMATSPTSISSSGSLSPKDPSHLFWVPASVHPEISPSDFRNFIKEHAARAVTQRAVTQRADQDDAATDDTLPPLALGDSPIAQRLISVRQQQQERQNQTNDAHGALLGRSTSLSRRGSTLRRQYRPENDTDETDEDKASLPLQRNRSGLNRADYGLSIPNLTIADLQRLEAAAEEASQTQDPAMLRSVLRRTLSLNTTPDLDTIDAKPADPVEDPDAPIIVPKPGQILRRAARTKMRKASGDSTRGSLASRRRAPRSSTDVDAAGAPSEGSRAWELQQTDSEDMERRHSGHSELSSGADDDSSAGDSSSRPVSTEATDSIVDAYSRDSYHSDVSQRTSVTSVFDSANSNHNTPSGSTGQLEMQSLSPPHTPTQDSYATLPTTQLDSDGTPQKRSDTHIQTPHSPARTNDSLETPRPDSKNQIKPIPVLHVPPVPAQDQNGQEAGQRRDAQKHATSAKPQVAPIVTSQQPQRINQPPRHTHSPPPATGSKHKEKERKGAFGLSCSSSFLGALFGKKKGHDEAAHPSAPRPASNSQLTAGSLLERNEMYGKSGAYFYSRYPIHIERAVYRLSHIKLANPRRPLYEQVLISNLMFWYLSVINRSNQGQYAQTQQQQDGNAQHQHEEQNRLHLAGQTAPIANGYSSASSGLIDTSTAYDGMEPLSNSSPDSEDGASSSDQYHSPSHGTALKQKRNGLVKPNRAPAGANRSRAETPMKQPGYGMQHRQIDDDFKTLGSTGGFVVGQVVDVKALQANTPYHFVPDPRADANGGYGDNMTKSATTDYLGLGNSFGAREPLWPSQSADVGDDEMQHGAERPDSVGSDGGQLSTTGEQKSSSSPTNRPYRSEAEKERAWLGMRNSTSSSGRSSSPTHSYGSISQVADNSSDTPHQDTCERPSELHAQGRSMSVGGIGAMSRTGTSDWNSSSASQRSRKVSMGHVSPSNSNQKLVPSISAGSISNFGSIEEHKCYGGMTPSISANAALEGAGGNMGSEAESDKRSNSSGDGGRAEGVTGGFNVYSTAGSSAMLDAARTSQSRRR